ncbi:MAG: aldehyde dehydrogenase family protein [Desulfobacteraceae bacterium]|nr:MAG: aldehyde dehydrogenase family protein [Desulfobacteraceae bacterium]
MKTYDKFFIDGRWTDPAGSKTIEVINPFTEKVCGRVPAGTVKDVDKAVQAARKAFDGWANTAPAERFAALAQIAGRLNERKDEIAQTISSELGMPITWAVAIQAGLPTGVMASYAEMAKEVQWEERIGNSLVVKEPAGVCAFITPWNYPLHQIVGKVAPALAAGCTMVVKPSSEAPLNAFLLAEIMAEVGLPPGVFNLVSGSGGIVGEAMCSHPQVDLISFTGSTRAGRRIGELAAQSVKRVTLELGGKSANLVLDDADFKRAVSHGVKDMCLNSGQTCSALTRMLVPASRQQEAVEIAQATAANIKMGSPDDPENYIGPLVSAAQREKVRSYIRKGLEEGAKLVCGGPDAPKGLERGYFVPPTIFADVDNRMTIAQEEIFGPVLCIIPYKDENDAVRIANDSIYGLSGAVWSANVERAQRVAKRLRTGQVSINGGGFNLRAPFGGYKQSGHGRELGPFGLEEFLEIKSLQVP